MTAKEFYNNNYTSDEEASTINLMLEFAKYHVEQALKAASENAEMKIVKYTDDYEIDRDSVLNAYPLENIK